MRLHDYLHRLDVRPDGGADARLRNLHLAHRERFLFENLTIQTGGTISLALADLERKFLDDGRGGYCFEHNTLFGAALRELGFEPVRLLGRVRRGPPEQWARTHMVLRVTAGGERWLADVGFGAFGLLEPIPMRDGAIATQGGLEYALRRDGQLWVLSMRDANGVTDLYEFTEEPQTTWDIEVANHFTATHPASIFRRSLTIQRSSRSERVVLRSDVLTRYRDGVPTDTPVRPEHLRAIVREEFAIVLPDHPLVFERPSGQAVP